MAGTRIRVRCLGEALIDFVACQTGTLNGARTFVRAAGGAPANVAVGLARLGTPSGLIAKIGDDPFGRYLFDVLRDEGVDITSVMLQPKVRTPLAFVSLTPNGERDFAFYWLFNSEAALHPEDLDLSWFKDLSFFHYGSIYLIETNSRQSSIEACAIAKRNGALVSFDPNIRYSLWPNENIANDIIRKFLCYNDLVKLSAEEALALTNCSHIQQAIENIWDYGMQMLVVTMGSSGAICRWAGGQLAHNGYAVQAVDSTGAGDAFMAALLHQLTIYLEQGTTLSSLTPAMVSDFLAFANAAAALCVQRKGAIPALARKKEVLEFLNGYEEAGNNASCNHD